MADEKTRPVKKSGEDYSGTWDAIYWGFQAAKNGWDLEHTRAEFNRLWFYRGESK